MRQFIRRLPVLHERPAWQADVFVIPKAFFDPVLMPDLPTPVWLRFAGMAGAGWPGDTAVNGFDRFIGSDKEFEFHLLEFARPKCEVARIDFIPKGFADLADTERNLLPRDEKNVRELREDSLRCLGTQIRLVIVANDGADISHQHEVERP